MICLFIVLCSASVCMAGENDSSTAKHYEGLAREASDQGNYALAIEYFTRAIELAPDVWRHYANRGIIVYEKGARDRVYGLGKEALAKEVHHQCMSDLSMAIELNPEGRQADKAYYNRARCEYMFSGVSTDYERMLADSEKAISLNPEDSDYYRVRYYAHSKLGNYKMAIADARKVIKMEPGTKGAEIALGHIEEYRQKMQTQESEGAYRFERAQQHSVENSDSNGTYIHDCPGGSSIVVRKGYMWHNTPNGGCITYPRDGTWHNCKDGSSVAVPRGWKVYQERDGGCFSYSP